MGTSDDGVLGRTHWLNFPFLAANAAVFVYGIYTIFTESASKGLVIVGLSVVLSFLVPVILGKLVRIKHDL